MAETTQTTFSGLRAEGLGAKEPQDAAEVALNVDFHRQMIEPRAGREVILGHNRPVGNPKPFPSGGIRLDGSRTWVQVVPGFESHLVNFAVGIIWRFDPRMWDWPNAQQGDLITAIYRTGGNHQPQFQIYVLRTGANLELWAAARMSGAGWVTTTAAIILAGGEGTVYRVVGYILRDYPNAGDTELGLRLYEDGSTTIAPGNEQIRQFIGDTHAGLGIDTRWALGAYGWDEPEAPTAYFYQKEELQGAIADFVYFGGELGAVGDALDDDKWLWDDPWPEGSNLDEMPKIRITMDKASSWVLEDTGVTPLAGTPAVAWVHPRPVLECHPTAKPARFVFPALSKGTTMAPPEVDALEQHALTIALDFRFPAWLGVGINNQDVAILASGDGWYLSLYHTAGGNFIVRLYTVASGGFVAIASLPAAGTLVANTSYSCAVAFDRRVGAVQAAYLWLDFGGWLAPVFTAIIHDSAVGVTDKQVNFGGFPTVGQYTKCVAILERMAVGLSPADPSAAPAGTTFDEFVDDMLSDEPRAPVCTAFIPYVDRTRYGHDDANISDAFTNTHEVLEINDWLGREEVVRCVPTEMTHSSQIDFFRARHPQKIRGAASYETDEGLFRIALMTDSAVMYWQPDTNVQTYPIEASAQHCYDAEVPVVAQSFRRRVFFFGSSSTRQKFTGDRSCAIGIERPFLFDIDVTEIAKLEGEEEAPILLGQHWFKVSLYNSRNGQESNLSNAIPYTVVADASGLLLKMNIGYRDGDDFDEVGIWRLHLTEGQYHLETRVRRSSWPGRESAGWLAYLSYLTIDNRVVVRMSQASLAAQPYEVFDNNPPPSSLVGCFHQDRLYLVPRDQPELVVWSKRHLVESFPSTQFARIGERAGDEIRALASSPVGLLVFTRRQTHLIARGSEDDPVPEVISIEAGCVSPATIAQSDRALMWLSERGVEGLIDGGIQLVARPIRNVFDDFTLEDMRTAKAAHWRRKNQYWIVIGSKLLTFDFDRGQWSEGVIGLSWIGSMPLSADGREDLCSGWWAYFLRQDDTSRVDGLYYVGLTTLSEEESIPNTSWYHLPAPLADHIYSVSVQGPVGLDDLPNYFFAAFDTHIYMGPELIIPICIDRRNDPTSNTYYFAEPFVPLAPDQFYLYRWVPCFYRSHLISAEGIETQKRIKSCRLHWDPESDEDPQPRVNVLPDGYAPGTGVSFYRPIGQRDEWTNEITWRMLCRAWKLTWSHWGVHWPAHSHVEWLYDLRRKV
jgi:hypothetical protein